MFIDSKLRFSEIKNNQEDKIDEVTKKIHT